MYIGTHYNIKMAWITFIIKIRQQQQFGRIDAIVKLVLRIYVKEAILGVPLHCTGN